MGTEFDSNQHPRARLGVRAAAKGQWRQILKAFGLDDRTLSGLPYACPICGGKDRFRFDDLEGRGSFYCNGCGPGDGVQLVMRLTGLPFRDAAQHIEELAGSAPVTTARQERSIADKRKSLNLIFGQSKPIERDDDSFRYLVGRGLALNRLPGSIRTHRGLQYFDRARAKLGVYPVMLGIVTSPSGSSLSMHRTYLHNGKKAPVEAPKKLMPGYSVAGGAIRLSPLGPCIGIAEGIESALAASELFAVPCWSCLSAQGIESFMPPPDVEELIVFADNDPNFVGQDAAWKAAERLTRLGLRVAVQIPPEIGDWLDVLNRSSGQKNIGRLNH